MVTPSASVFTRVPRALLVQTGSLRKTVLDQTCGERKYCRQPGTRQGPTWEAMLGRQKNAEVAGPGPVGFAHSICHGLQVKTFVILTNTLIDELPPT